MGIHNEPGLMEVPLVSTRELLNQMIGYALDTTDPDRSFVPFKKDGKDEVILMVRAPACSFLCFSFPDQMNSGQ